jgi:hypothetical protein
MSRIHTQCDNHTKELTRREEMTYVERQTIALERIADYLMEIANCVDDEDTVIRVRKVDE